MRSKLSLITQFIPFEKPFHHHRFFANVGHNVTFYTKTFDDVTTDATLRRTRLNVMKRKTFEQGRPYCIVFELTTVLNVCIVMLYESRQFTYHFKRNFSSWISSDDHLVVIMDGVSWYNSLMGTHDSLSHFGTQWWNSLGQVAISWLVDECTNILLVKEKRKKYLAAGDAQFGNLQPYYRGSLKTTGNDTLMTSLSPRPQFRYFLLHHHF